MANAAAYLGAGLLKGMSVGGTAVYKTKMDEEIQMAKELRAKNMGEELSDRNHKYAMEVSQMGIDARKDSALLKRENDLEDDAINIGNQYDLANKKIEAAAKVALTKHNWDIDAAKILARTKLSSSELTEFTRMQDDIFKSQIEQSNLLKEDKLTASDAANGIVPGTKQKPASERNKAAFDKQDIVIQKKIERLRQRFPKLSGALAEQEKTASDKKIMEDNYNSLTSVATTDEQTSVINEIIGKDRNLAKEIIKKWSTESPSEYQAWKATQPTPKDINNPDSSSNPDGGLLTNSISNRSVSVANDPRSKNGTETPFVNKRQKTQLEIAVDDHINKLNGLSKEEVFAKLSEWEKFAAKNKVFAKTLVEIKRKLKFKGL